MSQQILCLERKATKQKLVIFIVQARIHALTLQTMNALMLLICFEDHARSGKVDRSL
mgnify:CR=1 FL=1